MLRIVESKSKGLDISVDLHKETLITILDALLASAGVMFVKTQIDQSHVHFKVDAVDTGKIKTIITGWYQSMSDIQYAIDTRHEAP